MYANQPLTLEEEDDDDDDVYGAVLGNRRSGECDGDARVAVCSVALMGSQVTRFFDPFDSYPRTRLPRVHVQRLIQHCEIGPFPWDVVHG